MNFASERELAQTFCGLVNQTVWTIYPETGNFDLLLSRNSDGFQIGIEAKLTLNMKVVAQAADLATGGRGAALPGPDCRAVLVPWTKRPCSFTAVIRALQIVVLRVSGRKDSPCLSTGLPDAENSRGAWPEHFPATRLPLPDYVPDVAAGVAAPTKLTHWKIKAIKLKILLEKRGYLTRNDFIRFDISPSTWTQRGWIIQSNIRGHWVAGIGIPEFEKQHPVNYAQIEGDFPKWNSRDLEGII